MIYGTSEIDGLPCQLPRTAPAEPTVAYPNPADAELVLEQAPGVLLTVYNSQGQIVHSGKSGPPFEKIDTHRWPAGLYYLHTQRNQEIRRQQIRIEHR
ncbi:hypothetical protein GCM10022408_12530 [Hymenobacter fastidiosus]|uniref:Secretion system C-terminal sorting domain-containing protein n=1 Tax=Hymenobacter fastidiosus TaxID=486264 RepID=A0ABP7RV51_9BACT